MLTVAFVLKGLLEVSMMFLIAQGALWTLLLFTGKGSNENNFIYFLFDVINRPWKKLGIFLAPSFLQKKYSLWLSFAILFHMWILLTFLVLPELCSLNGLSIQMCKK